MRLMTVGALGSTVGERIKGQPWLRHLAWPHLSHIRTWIAEQFEAQRAHLMLYAPFCVLFGHWLYFSLYFQPPAWLTATFVVISFACFFGRRCCVYETGAWLYRRGFCEAKLRQSEVATPM